MKSHTHTVQYCAIMRVSELFLPSSQMTQFFFGNRCMYARRDSDETLGETLAGESRILQRKKKKIEIENFLVLLFELNTIIDNIRGVTRTFFYFFFFC